MGCCSRAGRGRPACIRAAWRFLDLQEGTRDIYQHFPALEVIEVSEYLDGLDVPIEFPLGLRTAIESGGCVLFLGAGVGAHLRDSEGKQLPDGEQLARELAGNFKIDCGDNYDLTRVAEAVEVRRGRAELEAFLQKRLANGVRLL